MASGPAPWTVCPPPSPGRPAAHPRTAKIRVEFSGSLGHFLADRGLAGAGRPESVAAEPSFTGRVGDSDEPSVASVGRRIEGALGAAATRRCRLHDMHDAGAARQLRADRTLRRTARLHAVQRGDASGGTGLGRPALRLPAAEASVLRQVHAGRRPLCSDLLRLVDGHGRGAVSQVRGDRRPPLLRRARSRPCSRSTRWGSGAAPAR